MLRKTYACILTVLLQTLLLNCELLSQSVCGDSFYQDKIDELCQPKICGIQTWTPPLSDNFLTDAQSLSSLIFKHQSTNIPVKKGLSSF